MQITGCRRKKKKGVRDWELWIIKVVPVIIVTMTVNITQTVVGHLLFIRYFEFFVSQSTCVCYFRAKNGGQP